MSATLEITNQSNRALDAEDWYEVINGERREVKPMGAYENLLASVLSHLMTTFATSKRLGLVAVEVLFSLRSEPLLQRKPDVAFVSRSRCRQNRIRRTSAWDVVPDLAIEFVSATNLADEIEAKLVDYFATGVRQVWVIYPETRRVYVHQSLQTVRGYSEDEAIDASPVLPGFTFRLADLFDAIENIDDDTP
ncbi:MAG: Uma2 family endonuclease [Planctomycetaceae bacterium]